MKKQLIVTIVGADQKGILSALSREVHNTNCNILDSRQAIYGQDFSLTMILEGSPQAITRAEVKLPALCQSLDLLSMMKRTSEHSKQHLDFLVEAEFTGGDASGLLEQITHFFSAHNGMISAFRQKTFADSNGNLQARCKMVVSFPSPADMDRMERDFSDLMSDLQLTGKLYKKQHKDTDEQINQWQ